MALFRSTTMLVIFGAANAGFARMSNAGVDVSTPPPEAMEAAVFMDMPNNNAPVIVTATVEAKQNRSLLTQGSNEGSTGAVRLEGGTIEKDESQVDTLVVKPTNSTVLDGLAVPPPEMVPHSIRSQLWTWLQYLTLGAIVKISCIIGNVLSQLSPYPSVKKFHMKGDTGDFDALPLVSIGFNGLQWCFYGLFAWWITGNHAFMILLYANVCGAIAGSFYTYSFHRLCRNDKGFRALIRYYNVCMAILFVQVLAALALPRRSAMFFEGFMASFCSVAVAVSPIACLPTVLRTESTEAMPVELAFVSFLSSVLWLTCGIMLMDWWIIIPNVVGILAGLFAMALLFIYPNKAKQGSATEATPLTTQSASAALAAATWPLAFVDDGCTGGTPSCGLAGDKSEPGQEHSLQIPQMLL